MKALIPFLFLVFLANLPLGTQQFLSLISIQQLQAKPPKPIHHQKIKKPEALKGKQATHKKLKARKQASLQKSKKNIAPKKTKAKRTPQAWANIKQPSQHTKASAIGGYSYGCLLGAKAIPASGIGYQTIRRERNRYYGHPHTLEVIREIGKVAHEKQLTVIEIGDLSQPVGGLMSFGHKSHQIGLDIDIWFGLSKEADKKIKENDFQSKHPPLVDPIKEEINPNAWDNQRHLLLLKTASQHTFVNRIFVHWAIKQELCQQYKADKKAHQEGLENSEGSKVILDEFNAIPTEEDEQEVDLIEEEGILKNQPLPDAGLSPLPDVALSPLPDAAPQSTIDDKWAWISKIRPWYGHDQHFHIRLSCPSDNPLCEGQGNVRGMGCEELALKKFSHRYKGWVKQKEDELRLKREEEQAKRPALTDAQKAEKLKKNKELQEKWLKQRALVDQKCLELIPKKLVKTPSRKSKK